MPLTQAQKDLILGMKLHGCGTEQMLLTGIQLWHPDDIVEMILYMANNMEATPAELYKMSSKISSERDRLMEAEEAENPENPENPEEAEEAED